MKIFNIPLTRLTRITTKLYINYIYDYRGLIVIDEINIISLIYELNELIKL